jgi:hypothetical protein
MLKNGFVKVTGVSIIFLKQIYQHLLNFKKNGCYSDMSEQNLFDTNQSTFVNYLIVK